MARNRRREFDRLTRIAAHRYGIPASVLAAQQQTESGFDPNAVSSAGAFGLTQFMPGTAPSYGVKRGSSHHAVATQILGQAKYLHDLGGRHDLAGALAKYAGGPGNPQPSYAQLVLGRAKGYRHLDHGGAPASGPRGKLRPVGSSGVTTTREQVEPGGTGVAGLLRTIQESQQPAQPSTPLPSPAFAAKAPLPQGYQELPSSGPVSAPLKVDDLLEAVKGLDNQGIAHSQVTGGGGGGLSGAVKARRDAHPSNLKGTRVFDGKRVAAWIYPELVYARKHGWKGTVTSGFRSFADQQRIYNSGVRPAARPGTSNHEGSDFPRGAVDVSDPQTLYRILRRKRSPLRYAGGKDPVHFSHPHGGGY